MNNQEFAELMLKFAEVLMRAYLFATFLCILSAIASVFMLWSVMKHERGADRVAWMIAVCAPILGPLMFVFLLLREREKRWMDSLEKREMNRCATLPGA